jgi:ferritin-like metal-binding protein YciE
MKSTSNEASKHTNVEAEHNGDHSPKTAKKATKAAKGEHTDSRLEEFFEDELKDIYWAEKHLVKTLPKMKEAATSAELKEAIADHLTVTKTQVTRLEQIFEMLGKKPQAKKCEAMKGITEEGEDIIEETEDGTATRDVGIIMAAQKVEHYEIATYGGLAQLARTLGKEDIAEILEETLQEEKVADAKLSGIAEENVNYYASTEPKKGKA